MKKFLYTLLVLSIAGAALSALLLIQHYFPGSDIAGMTCGDGLDNPCHSLSLTGYASIKGIPLAGVGLFFYLFILFTVLVADYAGESYYDAAAILAASLSGAAVAVNFVLAAILVKTGLFCTLCVWTYAVDILMLAAGVLWTRESARQRGASIAALVAGTARGIPETSGGRAALGLFVLFAALLGFSVFATVNIIEKQSGKREFTRKQINDYVTSFYAMEAEELDLPESPMIVGDPAAPLNIIAFTDFLCSACSSFFETEKYIMTRFPGKVSISYYGFPLDRSCNPTVNRTVYENSCIAARAVNAAARTGILGEYLKMHFKRYNEIKHGYAEETAMSVFNDAVKYSVKKSTPGEYRKILQSDDIDTAVRNDIELARENDIRSTPTLFIGGRRMRGAPPKEMLEEIIRLELEKKKTESAR